MSLWLDLAIVLITIITFAVVMFRGFIKTVFDLTSVIFAIVFGKMFSAHVSNFFYDFLYKHFSGSIESVVTKFLTENDLPSALKLDNLLTLLGKYNPDLANSLGSDGVNDGFRVIVESVVGLLSYAVAFLLIFVLTIIVFRILSVVLSTVFKLPVLKTINKTLSFVLAVIMCFVYINLFVAFMQIISPVISSVYPETLNADIIKQTFLFKFFYNFEWIKFLVN